VRLPQHRLQYAVKAIKTVLAEREDSALQKQKPTFGNALSQFCSLSSSRCILMLPFYLLLSYINTRFMYSETYNLIKVFQGKGHTRLTHATGNLDCKGFCKIFSQILRLTFIIPRTTGSMKTAVFWVAAPCSLAEVHRRFSGAFCLRFQGDDGPTALQPRRQPSSYHTELKNSPVDVRVPIKLHHLPTRVHWAFKG
jgi:hypothetical protein